MNFDRILEKLKNLDKLGKMSLIRWGILVLSIIFVILCEIEALPRMATFIFAILLWSSVIAFIVLSIVIYSKKKKEKANKSY